MPLKLGGDKKKQIANMIGYGYLDPLIKNDNLEEIVYDWIQNYYEEKEKILKKIST